MFNSVAHIGFTISSTERSVEFYTDVLGLNYIGQMYMSGPETEALFVRKGCRARVSYLQAEDKSSPLVELIEFLDLPSEKTEPCLFKTSISELCFAVKDIDAEYSRLLEKGVEFLSPPQSFDSSDYGFGRSRAVYLKDPDGNILELIEAL